MTMEQTNGRDFSRPSVPSERLTKGEVMHIRFKTQPSLLPRLFIVVVILIAVLIACGQTSRITSDARPMPSSSILPVPHGTIFIPPNDQIFTLTLTNQIPIVVREEVWSNVVRRTIWYKDGHAQTNDAIIASNLLTVITNTL